MVFRRVASGDAMIVDHDVVSGPTRENARPAIEQPASVPVTAVAEAMDAGYTTDRSLACGRRAGFVLEHYAVDGCDMGALRNLCPRFCRAADFFLSDLARTESAGITRAEALCRRASGDRRRGRRLAGRRNRQRGKCVPVCHGRNDSIRGLGSARHAHRAGVGHSASLSVLRSTDRRVPDADAHQLDGRLYRRGASGYWRTRLS